MQPASYEKNITNQQWKLRIPANQVWASKWLPLFDQRVLTTEYPATLNNFCVAGYAVRSQIPTDQVGYAVRGTQNFIWRVA